GIKMSSPNDVRMEEVPLEDDERDSIEYRILMAYAQRRLSVSKYKNLLKNEATVLKSPPLLHYQGPMPVLQGGGIKQHRKKKPERSYFQEHSLNFFCSRGEQKKSPTLSLQQHHMERLIACFISHPPSQSGERPDVNHIADKLAKLVTSRSQESPSDVSFRINYEGPSVEKDDSDPADETEGEDHGMDEEKIIQKIVSLLRQSGDKLEGKIKKDRVFYQRFKDMLSYTFFEKVTDLFLKDISAVSTSEPRGQCRKVAFTMEIATRLTAVDNHPMNLVLGFGSKYLREHFRPWIQDQGGWVCVLSAL
ncbi:B2L14 protein, partial [Turnix velox]|nr:B2L14 protein [Turnix velox]